MTTGTYKQLLPWFAVFDPDEDFLEPLYPVQVSRTTRESLLTKYYWEKIHICICSSLCFGSIHIALRLTLFIHLLIYV
jgi:hypothetical protein